MFTILIEASSKFEILPPCKLREVRETREVAKVVADILKQKVKELVELWDNVQAKQKNMVVTAAIDPALELSTTKRLCTTKGSGLVQDVTPVPKAKRAQGVTPVARMKKAVVVTPDNIPITKQKKLQAQAKTKLKIPLSTSAKTKTTPADTSSDDVVDVDAPAMDIDR